MNQPKPVNRVAQYLDPADQESTGDRYMLLLMRGPQHFFFVFDAQHLAATLNTFGRFAAAHNLEFTWYDAGVLATRARKLVSQSLSKGPNDECC